MLKKLKQKFVPILLGLVVVYGAYWFETTPIQAVDLLSERLNNLIYDIRMWVYIHQHPTKADSNVVVIDIDEKSLKAEGRWPWPRNMMADLVEELRRQGVLTIAIDIMFSEPERNISEQLVKDEPNPDVLDAATEEYLKNISHYYDNDQTFADAINSSDVVLGFVLTASSEDHVGTLPNPLLTLSPEETDQIGITNMPGYIVNIDKLSTKTDAHGFVTNLTDDDGVIRHYPIILMHENYVYGSLGLRAVMQYMLVKGIELDLADTTDSKLILEHVLLGNRAIPTDEFGQVLIPYKGNSRSYEYFSATDILNHKVPEGVLKNKIAFIGTSAIGLGDLHATPFESEFPGVEIHATVADVILSGVFPVEPDWDFGALLAMIFIMGVTFSLLAPFLSVAWALFAPLIIIFALAYFNIWLWDHEQLYLSSFIVYVMMFAISLVNVAYGYLFEARKRSQMKEMFGQYVPPAHVEQMTESKKAYTFEGEARNMSVLFADIRNFTSISEKLSPNQLKTLLNEYFTPMTEIIFQNNGTIDKYVGDMIMAFWGAPLENKKHALDAVKAGFAMLRKAEMLTQQFKVMGVNDIHIGVGINTGNMNVGDMGSKYRRSYTVLGDAVNLGSRLESSTKFYHVSFIISQYTLADLHNQVIVRHLDRVKVKGKEDAVEIFEPLCMREDMTDDMKEEIRLHGEALKHYYAAEWNEAMEAFKTLHERYSDVYVYEMFLKRIPQLIADNIEPDWDGCFVREDK